MESLQIAILCAREVLYNNGSTITHKDLPMMIQGIAVRYEQRLQNATYLYDCCQTLTYAEKQQRAFERQIQINNEKPPVFLPAAVPDKFFEQLYKLKIQHGFHMPNLSHSDCIWHYRNLYQKCSVQPIPSALLPLLLTIYSVDGVPFGNLYAFFKCKNRRLSKETQKQVYALFSSISKLAAEHIPAASHLAIPIFRWPDIEKAFFEQHNLSGEDVETAKQYFEQYRVHNDLSKKQERELLKLSYGGDIRSLAK